MNVGNLCHSVTASETIENRKDNFVMKIRNWRNLLNYFGILKDDLLLSVIVHNTLVYFLHLLYCTSVIILL